MQNVYIWYVDGVPFVVFLLAPFLFHVNAFATQQVSSTHYTAIQTQIGVGSNNGTSSSDYTGQVEVGDLGVGNYQSSDYQAYAGFNTTSQPFLQFVVTSETVNAQVTSTGFLSVGGTGTATAQFYVRAWNAGGYTVFTNSPPPTNNSNGYQMAFNTTATASTAGTEQFGMNLVANTTSPPPSGIPGSANPVNGVSTIPGSGQAYGQFAIPNKYAYYYNGSSAFPGTEIAYSNSSSSSTIFTASFIFNISGSTPSGQYNWVSQFVAVGTY